MAYVANQQLTRIDPYLDYLFAEWAHVPEVAKEWADWDEPDRLLFVLEWPIKEDRLAQLRGWVAEGALTPEQMARYHELLALVERHRRILEPLLSEDDPTIPRRHARGASA